MEKTPMTFEQACDKVAKKTKYKNWKNLTQLLEQERKFYSEAALLFARENVKQAVKLRSEMDWNKADKVPFKYTESEILELLSLNDNKK